MSAGKSVQTAHLVELCWGLFSNRCERCRLLWWHHSIPSPEAPDSWHNSYLVRFEPEDCPPVDYYAKNNIALPTAQNTCKVHEVIRQQPPPLDPDKWVKAAEFVPKRVHLQATAIPVVGEERVESPPSDPRQYQNVSREGEVKPNERTQTFRWCPHNPVGQPRHINRHLCQCLHSWLVVNRHKPPPIYNYCIRYVCSNISRRYSRKHKHNYIMCTNCDKHNNNSCNNIDLHKSVK
jgi:hypothetical protein